MKLFSEIAGTGSSSSSQLPLSIDRETRNEITNFVRYYVHKLIPALERTPSLFVEILFQKSQSDFFYFEHGFDKPAPEPRTAKAKAGLMFADDAFAEELENKFAIVVAALIDDEKGDLVEWAIDALNQVYQRRASWIQLSAATPEAGDSPLPPDERKFSFKKQQHIIIHSDTSQAFFSPVIRSTESKIIDGLQKEQKLILLLKLSGCKFEGKHTVKLSLINSFY